jgi:CubicO group peptidase (beta-lactamase class C family)
MPTAVDALLERHFADEDAMGLSLAVLVVDRDGRTIVERYGNGAAADTPLISWSMAKSMCHCAVGVLVGDGALSAGDGAQFEAWAGDERATITLEHMLRMTDGLAFNEDYVDGETSDTIEMLFGAGADDIVGYASGRPLAVTPGTRWSYSSGTTNLIADVASRAAGGLRADAWGAWLADRVFGPAGMRSAEPRFDAAGSWVASSYVYATAADFARFGLVYLRDGDGIVDPSWVAHARQPTPGVDEPDRGYGAQWWLWPDRPGWLVAQGYETQRIIVDYDHDLVAVRLGKTPNELGGAHVDALLKELIDTLAG